MQYIHSDLGYRNRGEIVEVTLSGNQANVVLMTSSAFSSFRSTGRVNGVGGLATKSPVRLAIPSSGHWYGVVYLPGFGGRVRAGFRVITPALPLPAIRETRSSPLGSIREAAREFSESVASADLPDRAYDVFISHAGEDKPEVVRPLAKALRELGLAVWYDEFELTIGDSLRRNIDRGLVASRFGVVVLSPSFFEKGWPNYELDGLVTREVSGGRQLILPVWHNVSRSDVAGYSPSLADKVARSTSDRTIDEIAAEIAAVVRPEEVDDISP